MSQKLHSADWIGKLVTVFAQSKLTVLLIAASILLGLFSAMNLPREEEPQISVPIFDVFVSYPGASSQDVEKRIVNLGERKLWEIPGVEYIYSTAETDGALFVVRFKVGSNVEESLIKLYTKVYANFDVLPQGASQPLIKLRSIDDVSVLALTFYGREKSPLELRRAAARIQTLVNAIPNVSETTLIGGKKRWFEVYFDDTKLNDRLISPIEIQKLIRERNIKESSGHLEGKDRVVQVEADSFFRSKKDLEDLVVGSSLGQILYLKDIARVVDGPDDLEQSASIRFLKDGPKGVYPAVTLTISKRKGTNASQLNEKILEKLKEWKRSVIPPEVQVSVTRDYGETATEKSNELLFHMLIAIFGVSLLIAFSLGWRESGVVAVAIPMTLALTLTTFYFLGFTLNRITLFALIFSIGILVDDPIVDVENIVRHMRMPKNKGRPLLEVTIEAVNEVRSPLILATLTVIVAILPMAFVRGLMGPYMRPIPMGSTAAMIFSMVVAFVATPWTSYQILRGVKKDEKLHEAGEREDFLTRLYRSYMKPLIYQPRVRKLFLIFMVVLLFLSILLIPLKAVRVKMLPFDNKNEFQVVLDMPEGTSFERTSKVINEIAAYLETVPEVKNIETYVGTSAPYNFNGLVRHYFLRNKPYQADLQVNLSPKNKRHRQSHDIAKSIRPKIHEIVSSVGGHVQVAEVPPGPPVLSTLVFEIYGPTREGQDQLAGSIEDLLSKSSSVTDIHTYVSANELLSRIRIDHEKSSLNGIEISEITKTLKASIAGEAVDLAHLENEDEPVEIRLRLPEEKRQNLDAVLGLKLLSKTGNPIPIRDLVTVEQLLKDKPIYHKNLMRVSYVLAEVAGPLESPVYAIFDLGKHIESLPLPKTFALTDQKNLEQIYTHQPDSDRLWTVKWDGEWHITYEVFRDLGIAFAAVLVLIFILIVGWFGSFKTPFIVMLPIPLTLVGILPAHWLTHTFFTATSMIGLIAGAGIVVRNAIILVDFTEQRLADGMSLEEAVIDAGAKRFRPMLLTAMAVVVGASVIFFDPIFQGLALSLVAGEIASTILSRTAVPVIYYMMMKK